MPRDSSGNYTLPAGNPVVTDTVITSDWANSTMSDLGNEMTNSLSRNGQGGMLAPLPFVDGTEVQPGITFILEPSLGFYRISEGRIAMAGLGDTAFLFDTVSQNISVGGTVPIQPEDLTRKDYVDGLSANTTIAADLTGAAGIIWSDLPADIVEFSVPIANANLGDTANILLRLGDTNTPIITGYSSLASNIADGVFPVVNNPNTTGFVAAAANMALNDICHGVFKGSRIGDSNSWLLTASFINLTSLIQYSNTGIISLPGAVLSIQILQSSGLFDSGLTGLTYQRSVT